MTTNTKPMIILIAGPYRSGTNDDPSLIAQNLDRLESFASSVYKAGHIPMIGEWVALPLMKQAGSQKLGDAISEQYLYPVASRLLQRCDAVLRIPGTQRAPIRMCASHANADCRFTCALKMCPFSPQCPCNNPFARSAKA
jgi:hypothetical protein